MQTTLTHRPHPYPPPIYQHRQSIETDLQHIAMNWNLTPSTICTASPTPPSPIPSPLSPNPNPLTWSPLLISALRRLSELTIGRKERAYALLGTYFIGRMREGGKNGGSYLEVVDVREAMGSIEVVNRGQNFQGGMMGGVGKRKREWEWEGGEDDLRTPGNRGKIIEDVKTPFMSAGASPRFGRVVAAGVYGTPVSMAGASRCSTSLSNARSESMPHFFPITPRSLSQRRSESRPYILRTRSFTPLSLKTTGLSSFVPLQRPTTLPQPHYVQTQTQLQPQTEKFPPKTPISALLDSDLERPFKSKHQQSTTDTDQQSFEFHLPPLSALFPPTPTPANFHAGNSGALWNKSPVLQKVPASLTEGSVTSQQLFGGPVSSFSTAFSPSLLNLFTEWPDTPTDVCVSKTVGGEGDDVKEAEKADVKVGYVENDECENKKMEGDGDEQMDAKREAEMARLLSCA